MPRKNTKRHNDGKPRWSLLMRHMTPALTSVVRVAELGAKRCPDRWLQYDPTETLESAMRHLAAAMAGETNDPESGQPHWAHLAWNALAYGVLRIREGEK